MRPLTDAIQAKEVQANGAGEQCGQEQCGQEQCGQEGTGTVSADRYVPSKAAVRSLARTLTAGSREHYDYAVWPGRRSAQAAPSALTRPKGA